MIPYEEAQGFQRLLDLPGYDVAVLAEKTGKSESLVYARLALLQLIPEVAEAFQQERITASHATLIARLPRDRQKDAFEQCWRKGLAGERTSLAPLQNTSPHRLPTVCTSRWTKRLLTGRMRASIPMPGRAQPAHVAADTTPHCSPMFLETNA